MINETDKEAVAKALALCEIEAIAHKNIHKISDGQLQKTLIARAIAQDCPLMILDEPTVHLDPNNRYLIIELLSKVAHQSNKCILLSTHQVEMAIDLSDKIWLAKSENTLLAAVLAKGRTVIENAAREPEIVDIANMLKKMGANINGAGTSEIIIEGIDKLTPADHEIIGDRIAAGTFLVAILSSGGYGKINGINPDHLPMEIKKLNEMGAKIETNSTSISVEYQDNLQAIELSTLPFPGVATDLQPIFGSALLLADGTSILTENVYDQRFQWIPEVQRMGANIQTGWQHAMIKGVKRLSGAPVHATDIRTGASLIIAALQADGFSTISGIDHINRGYEDIVMSLSSLGGVIEYNNNDG